MALVLDHILIAVHALQAAMDDYASLGFRVRRGATEAQTQRASVDFADGTRLELLAWTAPAPHDPRWQRLQQHGEGIAGYGLATAPPAAGRDAVHANGATGIESLAIAVRDVDAELARLRALVPPGDGGVHIGQALALPVAGTRLGTVQLGGSALLLMAPRGSTGPLHEEHPLALRLAACGEGPYAVVLCTHSAQAWAVDLRLAHGAAIEFVPAPAPASAPRPSLSTAMVGG